MEIKNLIQHIAQFTKLKQETIVDSFCLNYRYLLESNNFKIVFIPCFHDDKPKEIIKNILFAAYFKEKYNSKIILVANKNHKNLFIYNLFNQYYDKYFECKKYFELENIAQQYHVTKVIYTNQLLPHDAKRIIKRIEIIPNIDMILDDDNFYTFITTDKKNKTDLAFWLDETNNYKYNVHHILMSLCYQADSENIYNYIAPFLGMKIISRVGLYNDSIFDFSESKQNGLITMS